MSSKPQPICSGEESLTPQQRRDLERIRDAKRKARETRRRSDAVKAHCLECVGGKWKDLRECSSPSCPLKPFRMGRKDPDADFDTELVQ
jgi:hypothetical protein